MTIKNIANTVTTGMLLLFATCTQAASVTYILDQSNRFEDGIDYLSVVLSDDAEESMLSVTVSMLPALQSLIDSAVANSTACLTSRRHRPPTRTSKR